MGVLLLICTVYDARLVRKPPRLSGTPPREGNFSPAVGGMIPLLWRGRGGLLTKHSSFRTGQISILFFRWIERCDSTDATSKPTFWNHPAIGQDTINRLPHRRIVDTINSRGTVSRRQFFGRNKRYQHVLGDKVAERFL